MEKKTPLCVYVGLWNAEKKNVETKNVFCTKQGWWEQNAHDGDISTLSPSWHQVWTFGDEGTLPPSLSSINVFILCE